jgi:hypothetical protein
VFLLAGPSGEEEKRGCVGGSWLCLSCPVMAPRGSGGTARPSLDGVGGGLCLPMLKVSVPVFRCQD